MLYVNVSATGLYQKDEFTQYYIPCGILGRIRVFSIKRKFEFVQCIFWTYWICSTVCLGAMGDVKGAHEIFKEVPGLLKKKNNQIEAYVSRRVSYTGFLLLHLILRFTVTCHYLSPRPERSAEQSDHPSVRTPVRNIFREPSAPLTYSN